MNQLYLGVAKENITPPVGGLLYGYVLDVHSNAIEDDLTATAFWFRQGNKQALMVSLTVCLIHSDLSDEILALLAEEFDIPAGNILLSATHTHSGPNTAGEEGWGPVDHEYCQNIFIPGIRKAVAAAKENIKAVKMASVVGESLVGVNRRELRPNDEIVLGQNHWGTMDPRMTILSFKDEKGKIVGNMIHYGAHGTAAGCNQEVTRDWSGIMTDGLEERSGGITAFFNGPQGDIGPRISNGKTTGNISYVHELGEIAARDAVAFYEEMGEYKDVELLVSSSVVEIPLKPRMKLEKAEEMLPAYKGKNVNLDGMICGHLEKVIASYSSDYQEKKVYCQNQTLIGLGDFIFAGFPYELFAEIGLRIDDAVKEKNILSLSNTNGTEGYFVTRDAIVRGGYEVGVFLYTHLQPWCDNADYHLLNGTLHHIREALK